VFKISILFLNTPKMGNYHRLFVFFDENLPTGKNVGEGQLREN